MRESALPSEDVSESSEPDFRIEIERRYNKSIVNRVYTFPKRTIFDNQQRGGDNDLNNKSLEKLRDVILVDLQEQNQERMRQERLRREQERLKRR